MARKKAARKKSPRTSRPRRPARPPRNGDPIDPVAAMRSEAERRGRSQQQSILDREPLRSWLLGLAELKSNLGAQLPWDDVTTRMSAAAHEVVRLHDESGRASAKVGERTRRLKAEEVEACRTYAAAPLTQRALKNYLSLRHPELWMKLKAAANGRGSGIRSDEV